MLRLGTLILTAVLLLPSGVASQRQEGRSVAACPTCPTSPGGSAETAEAQVFRETFRVILDYSLSELNDSTLWERAVDGLVDSLDDPYAAVLDPDEVSAFREETTGNYGGIGIQITQLNDSVTVTAVFRGSPAEEAGIQEGDRIVRVDEEWAEGWTAGDASDRIRGRVGTKVDVYVRRNGVREPIRHPISRGEIHLSAVTATTLEDSIAYVLVDRVARNSAAELDSVLTLHRNDRGLVLDLRRNPGGYLDEALRLADLFLEDGKILASTRSRRPGPGGEKVEERGYARSPARVSGMPIVVLVDRFTASAAEILAGALQDHDRALVLGERTFGKGVVQTILPLPAGRQFRLTTGEWYTPLGRSLHRPRDRQGRPLPDSVEPPMFRSAGGRELRGGGGIFPDLEIADDTLTLAERDLLDAANQAEVSLGLEITEFAFDRAQRVRGGEASPDLSEDEVAGFIQELASAGIPEEILANPSIRSYLGWRTRIALAQRLQDDRRAVEARIERDPVLATALELLEKARTPEDLFSLAAAEPVSAPVLETEERPAHGG